MIQTTDRPHTRAFDDTLFNESQSPLSPCALTTTGSINGRGERLRKREEERAIKRATKRRKLGKKPLEVDRSGGHEGRLKKHANKRRLEVEQLELVSSVFSR